MFRFRGSVIFCNHGIVTESILFKVGQYDQDRGSCKSAAGSALSKCHLACQLCVQEVFSLEILRLQGAIRARATNRIRQCFSGFPSVNFRIADLCYLDN